MRYTHLLGAAILAAPLLAVTSGADVDAAEITTDDCLLIITSLTSPSEITATIDLEATIAPEVGRTRSRLRRRGAQYSPVSSSRNRHAGTASIPSPRSRGPSSRRVTTSPRLSPCSAMASRRPATSRSRVLGSASDSHAWMRRRSPPRGATMKSTSLPDFVL